MRRLNPGKKKIGDRGETIVEVMVAFMVLLIVLAIFGNSILAAGEAQKYSIDIRREADKGMKDLQNALYAGGSGAEIKGKKTSAITEIEAYKYETADGLVYWVFQNKPGENGGAE